MSRVRSCLLAALFVVVGVVLSPLRAAAATIPTLFAYDGMVRPTTTTALGGQDAVRPAEPPSISAYEAAPFGYDDRPNVRVAARVGVVRAYDGGLNLDERSELAKGLIYDARTVTKAAEEIPTLVISRARMPNIAENIENALAAGHPGVLTRGAGQAAANANRAAALEAVEGVSFPAGSSVDEYPFASAVEGGGSSWLGQVPLREQQIQGGVITGFFSKFKVPVGGRFRVIVGD